jgi:hypothetical protein
MGGNLRKRTNAGLFASLHYVTYVYVIKRMNADINQSTGRNYAARLGTR